MAVTCLIEYQIDPFQRAAFRLYAETWVRVIPRCGGDLIGYFLSLEGTNDVAWALISFDTLASYEAYRVRLRAGPDAVANFAFAEERRLVVRERRTFIEPVVDSHGDRLPPHGQPLSVPLGVGVVDGMGVEVIAV